MSTRQGLKFIKFLQFLIVPFVVLMSVAVTGCKNIQEREWRKAHEKNTIIAYEEFLRKYPQSKFANEARVRINFLLKERHPSFKDVKRMGIIINEFYGEAEAVSLARDITDLISNILKYAGVEVVREKVEKNYTIEVNVEGRALKEYYYPTDDIANPPPYYYPGYHYTGAEVEFVILFEAKDGYVIEEEGEGNAAPPYVINRPYPTPNHAPFREAFLGEGVVGDSNINEVILKLVYKGFGIIPLIFTLWDEDGDLRWAAAKVLGNIGDARAVEPLVAVLRSEISYVAAEALDKLNWKPKDDNEKAIYLVAKEDWDECVKLGKPAVEVLIVALRAEYWDIRKEAASALGKIGDLRAVEPLIAALKDEYVQEVAAEALGKIGDTRAIEPLKEIAEKDSEPDVRKAAEQALEKIKQKAKGENQ